MTWKDFGACAPMLALIGLVMIFLGLLEPLNNSLAYRAVLLGVAITTLLAYVAADSDVLPSEATRKMCIYCWFFIGVMQILKILMICTPQ